MDNEPMTLVDKEGAGGEEEKEEVIHNEETLNGALTLLDKEGAGEEEEVEEEEEYVILDLDDVFHGAPALANHAYTLSDLDTLTPTLTLDNGLKLIGEYVETVGTVVVYSEKEVDVPEAQANPGECPTSVDTNAVNNEKKPLKRIQGVCKLERKLKFREIPTNDASSKDVVLSHLPLGREA